jgi:hypothetical protein
MSAGTIFKQIWSYLSQRGPDAPERRESGFTHEYLADRFEYIMGRRGLAELTSTVQSCVSLWENAFAACDVSGTTLLDSTSMAMIGRALALRGEIVLWISDIGLIPASSWALKTQYGKPVAYQIVIPEIGGGNAAQIMLAQEILHVRIGVDHHMPWIGSAPLRRSSLTAELLNAVEVALTEVYQHAPLGSQIVPYPESPTTDMEAIGRGFRGQRGRILLRESTAVTAAGSVAPPTDWKPQSVSPDLSQSMTEESLAAARQSILSAFGVLPALFDKATTGPLVREAQRHLAQWTLAPICELIEQEASEKLGTEIEIDVISPLHAYDEGGRARAFATTLEAMAQAKTAGVDAAGLAAAMKLTLWEES